MVKQISQPKKLCKIPKGKYETCDTTVNILKVATLDPGPWTLYPKPQEILHPAPCTLHPAF